MMATKEPDLNPISGLPPNSFSQSTTQTLGPPVNVRGGPIGPPKEGANMRKLHRDATAEGSSNAPTMGYGKTGGMSNEDHAWITGASHMFPNTAAEKNVPAINEPHPTDDGVTVQRRAEDLSGREMDKGKAILAHYGQNARDPLGSLKQTQDQNLQRVIGEHAAAGVDESASQHFYGGAPVTTHLDDETMNNLHQSGMRAANDRFQQGVSNIQDRMPEIQGVSQRKTATNVMAAAAADTSPNCKWRTGSGDKWPNMDQAEESVRAGLDGDQPKFIAGRIQNITKASDRVASMTATGNYDVHDVGDPKSAAKTIAFRGALVDQNSPDAYKVSDVHEGSQAFPGLPTSKSTVWKGEGDAHKTAFHPDQPKSVIAGKTQVMKTKPDGSISTIPDKGNSRVEEALGKGPYVHALNDYATRQSLDDHGLSRGVNYADNVHAMQGATWGSQQVKRSDVEVSHASQYPVVRDWAAEGHTPPMTDVGEAMFGGRTRNMSPQFTENPNTKSSVNPTNRPYPIDG